MAQTTHGVRSVLSRPWAYKLWQTLLGGQKGKADFADQYLRVEPGDAVLDIGCGTAGVLAVLPEGIDYVGLDQSKEYVEAAGRRFGSRGTFLHAAIGEAPPVLPRHFDLALALGVVHHLDDDEAVELFALAREALKPEGRLVTVDPVYDDEQSKLARWILSRDRGRNIRYRAGYEALAREQFRGVETEIRDDLLWFPYTHVIMTCRQRGRGASG